LAADDSTQKHWHRQPSSPPLRSDAEAISRGDKTLTGW
jgi:hypothetical protein